jgi:hypothetical protein
MKHSPNWKGLAKIGLAPLALAAGWMAVGPAGIAQYPGHIDTQVKAGPVLRSIAVLEWTGDPGKPKASRLIPVSVFEDGAYQDGGLYLARPQPLALENGTEYQLLRSGLPQGIYDVATSERRSGDWFGYGDWKPLPPPEAFHHLQPSKIDPEVVDGGGDRRPHFRKAAPDTGAPGSGAGAQPPADPDRPTLHKQRPPSGTPANTNDPPSAGSGDLETATGGGDPDRPRLTRGAHIENAASMGHLEDTPPNLEQMVAVSDAVTRPPHSFAYSWATPDDAAKMQAQLNDIALQAVTKAIAAQKTTPPKKQAAASQATATAHHTSVARKKPATPPFTLTDVNFKAFELTYSGGATLVLTARTTEEDLKTHYVTVIAQPDLYGVPQVMFTQVTRTEELDTSPRLLLIDAVDAAGDNRGELLFELRGTSTREFALYRVASGRVDQMIATAPLPLGKGVAD